MNSRKLFTDGWNSFWHVFFGILSIRFSIIIPIFVIYQLIDWNDKNLFIDITEFFIGFFGSILCISLLDSSKITHFLVDKYFLKWL